MLGIACCSKKNCPWCCLPKAAAAGGDTGTPWSQACAYLRGLCGALGSVPVVGITHGRCFAGNAALLEFAAM